MNSNHNPDGNMFLKNYVCKVPIGTECKTAEECISNKCDNSVCTNKQLNEECE